MKELTLNLPSDFESGQNISDKELRANDLKQRLGGLWPALETLGSSLNNFWMAQEELKSDLDEVEGKMAEPSEQISDHEPIENDLERLEVSGSLP
ncbi:MAG: hypothetical protein GY696_36955 [Gammaproteobacteria bacterium]|nr:hypothetical protein [Gammaproteobacteria bacterium]